MDVLNRNILYDIRGQHFQLLVDRAIYWADKKILLIADLHLGKISHFRKAGIALPRSAAYDCLLRFEKLLVDYSPERCIILGDLFHSSINVEWDNFVDLIWRYKQTQFELVKGNHDILQAEAYQKAPLVIHEEFLVIPPFILSHDNMSGVELYNLYGHVHPAVRLTGKARQAARIPCFYFTPDYGILPAFGTFTGTHTVDYGVEDDVFVIVADKVLKLE